MSHKGNFTTTQIASITLSLQELIDRQAAEIAGLKEERGKLQSRLNHVQSLLKDSAGKNARLEGKVETLTQMAEYKFKMLEGQGQLINDLHEQLEKRSVAPVFRLMSLFKGK
jgi:predicted nuclease with TOPRIM domain